MISDELIEAGYYLFDNESPNIVSNEYHWALVLHTMKSVSIDNADQSKSEGAGGQTSPAPRRFWSISVRSARAVLTRPEGKTEGKSVAGSLL